MNRVPFEWLADGWQVYDWWVGKRLESATSNLLKNPIETFWTNCRTLFIALTGYKCGILLLLAMPTKRKAESDHNASLLDFFSSENSSKTSPSKKINGSKKQKLDTPAKGKSSKVAGQRSLASGGRQHSRSENGLQPKNIIHKDIEVIEVLDSDDEEIEELLEIKSKQPESVSDNAGASNVERNSLNRSPNPISEREETNLDYESFFSDPVIPSELRSDVEEGQGIAKKALNELEFIDLEEEEAREVSVRLERMSPYDWETGEDDEVEQHAASAAASEPEDEGEEAAFTLSVQEEAELVDDDQMEVEPPEVEYIELEDDSPTSSPISSTQGLCPICRKDIRSYNESKDTLKEPSKPKVLQPISSFPVPSHPASLSHKEEIKEKPKGLNAFSFLMSRNKENEAWKEATEAEKSRWGKMQKGKGKAVPPEPRKRNSGKEEEIEEIKDDDEDVSTMTEKVVNGESSGGARRPAPFYKVMQGMPIAVDAFRYGKIPGVTAYLLTWKHGPIYCSHTTANLIIHMLDVDKKWVHPLPMNEKVVLPDTGGVTVTLIEANHCKQTVNAGDSTFHSAFVGTARIFRYLHCGDFRACPQQAMHPEIRSKRLDLVYLDTTYLDPK
ncbi:7185_t:CDS:2, partial [Acaulospora colombiana]